MKKVLTTRLGFWLNCLLIVLVALSLVISGFPSPVSAQDGDKNTVIGALGLKSTFHCISVYSNFAGDDNGENQATLEYREAGGSWLPGIPMTVDRRDTVISGGSPKSNPYKNQWRASIFGLQPNTEYEVRVTYTDQDGVAGSPVTATINTRNDNPPSTGNIYYVATTGSDWNPGSEALPFRTIQKAADTVQAGDKVLIKAGTYDEKVTILASGTADNYIAFMSYGDGDVVIDGRGVEEYGITVGVSGIVGTGSGTRQGGDYVRISGLKAVNSRYAGINVGGDNVIIENCEIRDFNEADDQNADHRTSGITVNNWGASNLVIRGNLITRNIGASGFDAPMGIHIRNEHSDQGGGHIIYGNQIIANNGNIKDGIGGLGNFSYPGSLYRDSDIYDNYIENCYDDGIEAEGGNMNVRVWSNTLEQHFWINPIEGRYRMGLAFSSTVIGPLYVFRNVMTGFTDAAFKLGHDSYGAAYIYHNTAYTTSASGNGITIYGGSGLDNMVFRNNIIHVGRYVIECENNSYDYDNLYTTSSDRFAKLYIDGTAHYYESLSAFQSATGQELNGISADSQFVDPANDDLSLQETSPCIDKGVILPGFNDENSPWPYSGSAPDLGAYEYDSGPPYATGHNPPKGATGVAPDTNIIVHVKDDGEGVDLDSIVMTVEGETVTLSISGTPSDYTLTYDPPADFEYSQVVDVTIDARDLASPHNVMPQDAYSFTIAAGNQFTFVVTADMREYSGNGSYDTPQYFRGVCEKIAALGEGAFMVSPGDIDPPADVKWTIEQHIGENYLWYPVVGNHEAETSSDMTWLRAYDYDSNGATPPDIVNTGPPNCVETTYSFDYENSHVVVINEYYDGSSDTGTDGDVDDALYNWLVADLNATDKTYIFVFGHEPAYPQPDADNGVERHVGDSLDQYPANRDRFWNLLQDESVVAYICGHTHSYSAVKIDGVWQLDAGHSQGMGSTETRSTFIMIHVDGDVVTFETYRDDYNGGPYTLADSGTLTTEALMEGDATLNEHVQISDAMLIAQYAVGLVTLSDDQLTCADTTDDGNATMADAMHIAQWLVDPDGTLGMLNKPLWETPADDDMLHPAP